MLQQHDDMELCTHALTHDYYHIPVEGIEISDITEHFIYFCVSNGC